MHGDGPNAADRITFREKVRTHDHAIAGGDDTEHIRIGNERGGETDGGLDAGEVRSEASAFVKNAEGS
jgi:hypothetical protein